MERTLTCTRPCSAPLAVAHSLRMQIIALHPRTPSGTLKFSTGSLVGCT